MGRVRMGPAGMAMGLWWGLGQHQPVRPPVGLWHHTPQTPWGGQGAVLRWALHHHRHPEGPASPRPGMVQVQHQRDAHRLLTFPAPPLPRHFALTSLLLSPAGRRRSGRISNFPPDSATGRFCNPALCKAGIAAGPQFLFLALAVRPRPGTLGVWGGGGRNHHLRGTSRGAPRGATSRWAVPAHTLAVALQFCTHFWTVSQPSVPPARLWSSWEGGIKGETPFFPGTEPPCLLAPPLIPERFGTGRSLPGSAPPDPAPPLVHGSTAGRAAGDSQDLASTALGAARSRAPRGRRGPTRAWLGLAPWLQSPWGCAHVPRRGSAARPRAGHGCCSLASLLAGCPPSTLRFIFGLFSSVPTAVG